MRRMGCCLLAALCLVLAACGGGGARPAGTETPTPAELALAVLDSQENAEGLEALAGGDLTDHLDLSCGLEGLWSEGAVYTASGMDGREVLVVALKAEDDADAAAGALEAYRVSRTGDFFGYAPEQAALLEGAAVLTGGGFAAFLACGDAAAAEAAYHSRLTGEAVPAMATPDAGVPPAPPSGDAPAADDSSAGEGYTPFEPPNLTDMTLYDTAPILAAWESGEESALSERDAAILSRCREVLEELIGGDMTDFEKELAVHDWLVEWGEYDASANASPDHSGRPDNQNPYGMLVGGYGICLGYATTFQLLMDLSGVECVTVVGAAFGSLEDHAWNMVRLAGAWYCVDVTWNDTSGSRSDPERNHRFFNVTSDQMRESDHQWDYAAVPEATAGDYRWDGLSGLPAPAS